MQRAIHRTGRDVTVRTPKTSTLTVVSVLRLKMTKSILSTAVPLEAVAEIHAGGGSQCSATNRRLSIRTSRWPRVLATCSCRLGSSELPVALGRQTRQPLRSPRGWRTRSAVPTPPAALDLLQVLLPTLAARGCGIPLGGEEHIDGTGQVGTFAGQRLEPVDGIAGIVEVAELVLQALGGLGRVAGGAAFD